MQTAPAHADPSPLRRIRPDGMRTPGYQSLLPPELIAPEAGTTIAGTMPQAPAALSSSLGALPQAPSSSPPPVGAFPQAPSYSPYQQNLVSDATARAQALLEEGRVRQHLADIQAQAARFSALGLQYQQSVWPQPQQLGYPPAQLPAAAQLGYQQQPLLVQQQSEFPPSANVAQHPSWTLANNQADDDYERVSAIRRLRRQR